MEDIHNKVNKETQEGETKMPRFNLNIAMRNRIKMQNPIKGIEEGDETQLSYPVLKATLKSANAEYDKAQNQKDRTYWGARIGETIELLNQHALKIQSKEEQK